MTYNAHNFTAGAPQNKRQSPLTLDQIAQRAPSALATRPTSARDPSVNLTCLLNRNCRMGFVAVAASL